MLDLICVLHVVNFARNSCLDCAGCVVLCVSRNDRLWLAVSAAGRRVVPDVHPLLARSARPHDGATGHRLAAVIAAAAPSKFHLRTALALCYKICDLWHIHVHV